MTRKNRNPPRRAYVDFHTFSKKMGLTPVQRVKTIKFWRKYVKM
jgi:hypothetical protein